MAQNNSNLHNSKKEKNDEFYTQLSDIENELKHYKDFFKGKVVYCNCDDARESNFFKYFSMNFEHLGLKKLITTGYKANGHGVCLVYDGDKNGNKIVDDSEIIVTELEGNGGFETAECVEFLKEADVVVTNPPFSLFRAYVKQLMDYNKKFLIIGNLNAVTCKEIFPYIKNNQLWLGYTYFHGGAAYFVGRKDLFDAEKISNSKHAYIKDDKLYWRVNGVRWFTNIEHEKHQSPIDLYKKYNEAEFPKYDNYNAIEVSKVSDIPIDYDGVMGVPISLLDKYCPKQFEILGLDRYMEDNPHYGKRFTINKKEIYARILIKKCV